MIRYYRPNIGWWPSPPSVNGGSEEWTGEHLVDWSTGRLLVTSEVMAFNKGQPRGEKLAIDGLRTRTLKSSDTNKYHVGGPYNGAKLRKWIKRKGRSPVEILTDVYVVVPYKGRYEYDSKADQYRWTN